MVDFRAGRGMATALATELIGYPGPMRVVELGLSAIQRANMERLITTMRQDAITAGEALITAETELDKLFAAGEADEASLTAKMHQVTHAQGQLRLIHLRTHLPTDDGTDRALCPTTGLSALTANHGLCESQPPRPERIGQSGRSSP